MNAAPSPAEAHVGMSMAISLIALGFGPLLLTVIVGLLTPGRKGSMKTRREVLVTPATVDQLMVVYYTRFVAEQFRCGHVGPGVLKATRASNAMIGSPLTIHTHASKPLEARMEFSQEGEGVLVTIELWMKDFVILDTGEGAFVDGMLDRLLGEDLQGQGPPKVLNRSMNSVTALYAAGLLTVLAPILLLRLPPPGVILGTTFGTGACWIEIMILGGFGIRDALARPDEMTGTRVSLVAMILGTLATLGIVAAVVFNPEIHQLVADMRASKN